jgi:hypothetical protein
MVTTTLNKIHDSLPYGSGFEKFRDAFPEVSDRNAPLNVLTVLQRCGLEPALWCLRTTEIENEDYKSELRILTSNIIEKILTEIKTKRRFIDDQFPYKVITLARNYARGDMSPEEVSRFEMGETYKSLMEERNERYGRSNDPKLFGFSLSRAVVESTYPDVTLAAYFAILTSHTFSSHPEVYKTEQEFKITLFKQFLNKY